eukprot:CCRYP_017197-RA/>CCRYP_017197-RA protein AED:0.16 eAED:0.16 QI:140/1/1/1/0.5/0.33/3/1414/256
MSLSRQVLSSPFDIPPKPRVTPSTTTQGKRTKASSRNRETSLGRCVSNIMSDSRVVRRSPFSPSFGKDNAVLCENAQTNRGQCIMFDSRLLRDNESIFASPIVTVIEMDHTTNVNDENQARTTATKKRSKQPKSSKAHRHIHVQTDDHVAHDNMSREKAAYADAGTQTDIHCLLDYDVDCDDETNSAENVASSSIDISREVITEELLEERTPNDSKTSSEGVEKNNGDEPPKEVLAVDEDVSKENSPLDTLLTAPT